MDAALPRGKSRRSGLAQLLSMASAYDALHSAVALLDTELRIVYQNAAFARLNAALRDAPDGHFGSAALLESNALQDRLRGALTADQRTVLEQRLYYSRLAPVALHLLAHPLGLPDGPADGLLLTVAEESLDYDNRHIARLQERVRHLAQRVEGLARDKQDGERLTRALLRDAPFAAVLLNRHRQVIQLNRAAEALLGRNTRAAVAHRCERLFDCHSAAAGCPLLDQGRAVELEETTALSADGRRLPVLRSAVVLATEEPIILETFFDISARKQAEAEIRRLNESNQLLLDATGEGIFGVDPELRCTFINSAGARMLGYDAKALLGCNLHRLLHHSREDSSPLEPSDTAVAASIREDTSCRANNTVLWRRDGTPLPVEYLANPVHDRARIIGAVVVFRDVTQARAMSRKMDFLATHDPLTGLVNRREFECRLQDALDEVRRYNQQHVLCYVDLDQFKIVNDTCGHAAGDELLRQLTTVLHTQVRVTDTLARLGGDEFGLLLRDCDLDRALPLADALRAAIEDFRFAWDGRTFVVGASLGLASIDADTPDTGAVLSAADSACYIAKEHGRNRVHLYRPNDEELARRHGEMQWIGRISEALELDRLQLWCQRIVPVRGADKSLRLEILARIVEPDGTLIPPGAFIPAAERYNLMRSVDEWVVRHALDWLRRNHVGMRSLALCTINLSGQSVGDERFHAFLLEQIHEHHIPPGRICFEITETAAVANLSHAERLIRELRAHGCRFALDDFGSGMSSFGYLKTLPVDFLKIDGHFVRDLDQDPVDYAMVEAIHQVAHVMGLQTIAEFVETDAILERLRTIGVDLAQGYGIAKPHPLQMLS